MGDLISLVHPELRMEEIKKRRHSTEAPTMRVILLRTDYIDAKHRRYFFTDTPMKPEADIRFVHVGNPGMFEMDVVYNVHIEKEG